LVTLDPYEANQHLQFSVKRSNIRTLPPSVLQLICTGHCSRMCKTALPEIYATINQLLCVRRKAYLVSCGVPGQILDRLVQSVDSGAFSVGEFPLVRALARKLHRLLSTQNSSITQFVERLHEDAGQRLEAMLTRLNCREMLRSDQVSALSNLNRYRGALRSTIWRNMSTLIAQAIRWRQALQERMRALIDGRQKNVISDWWLELIESRTHQFLLDAGFHQNSYPANYIEWPPTNMKLVRDNLHLLSCVLDPRNERYGVRAFVQRLSSVIYARLDRFVADVICVFCIEFGRDPDPNTPLDELRRLVEGNGVRLQGAQRKLLENSLDDIEYVHTMHEMEEAFGATSDEPTKLKLTAVVPVSGLIMSAFVRRQKELETVEEVWSLPDEEGSTSSSGAGTFSGTTWTGSLLGFSELEADLSKDHERHSSSPNESEDEAEVGDGGEAACKDAAKDRKQSDASERPFAFILSEPNRKWLPTTYQTMGRRYRRQVRQQQLLQKQSQQLKRSDPKHRLSHPGSAADSIAATLPPAPPPPSTHISASLRTQSQ
jgi:hypothetical protein